MTPNPALEPCPFCGKQDAKVQSVKEDSAKYVACLNCSAEGPVEQEDGPVAAWNRRASSPTKDNEAGIMYVAQLAALIVKKDEALKKAAREIVDLCGGSWRAAPLYISAALSLTSESVEVARCREVVEAERKVLEAAERRRDYDEMLLNDFHEKYGTSWYSQACDDAIVNTVALMIAARIKKT